MAEIQVLWVDDEIESLQAQVIFLQQKGYSVTAVSNGFDAIELVKSQFFDVVLMDESMPGISGLQTMQQLKAINKLLPVVLITRNDTERLMDEAIGSEIADYLIKPVNPQQVLLSLKKIIDNRRLVAETTTSQYRHLPHSIPWKKEEITTKIPTTLLQLVQLPLQQRKRW